VEQDFYGLLLAHFGVRCVMEEAARSERIEPAELSFLHAVRVVVRRLPEMVSFSPSGGTGRPIAAWSLRSPRNASRNEPTGHYPAQRKTAVSLSNNPTDGPRRPILHRAAMRRTMLKLTPLGR